MFIWLTRKGRKALYNVNNIFAVYQNTSSESGSIVCSSGADEDGHFVAESPQEIAELIENAWAMKKGAKKIVEI